LEVVVLVEVEVDELAQFAGAKPFVVVGIPAFNEEKTIARVVLEAQRHADAVVVCDDGSSDLTCRIAQRLGADVVRHERNLGYGAAIKSLFERARELGADVLVTLDGDGQHNPDEIPSVAEPVISGVADIAVGSRFIDKRNGAVVPWYRRAGIRFISRLVDNRTKQGVLDAQSGFRAYGSKCLDGLTMEENGMGASVEILMSARKQGLRILEVPASCDYGADLKKHVQHPVRHGSNVLMSIIKLVVEDKPLVMLGIPGILCLIAGAIFGVWMLQIYAEEHAITTNIALASIGFLMIGFFCLSTAITLYAIYRLKNSRER
jgi:hypothetical protein